jgi:hypothetical protein
MSLTTRRLRVFDAAAANDLLYLLLLLGRWAACETVFVVCAVLVWRRLRSAESGYTRARVMCVFTDSKHALAWNSLYGCGFLQVSCAVCSGGLRAASGVRLRSLCRGVPCRVVGVWWKCAGRADRAYVCECV